MSRPPEKARTTRLMLSAIRRLPNAAAGARANAHQRLPPFKQETGVSIKPLFANYLGGSPTMTMLLTAVLWRQH